METFKMPRQYFDGFLSEYLLGALPLKRRILQVNSIFISGGTENRGDAGHQKSYERRVGFKRRKIYSRLFGFRSESDKSEIVYSIDIQSREILKSVVSLPDGSMFVKTIV